MERNYVEEFAAETYDYDLSNQDGKGNKYISTAIFEVERRAPCLKSTGIEHVPELKEYENREEE